MTRAISAEMLGIIPALNFHSTMPHLPAYLPSLTLHYTITSQVSCLESACRLTLTADTPRSTTLPGFQSKGEKRRERITALITHDATDPYDDGALPAFFFFELAIADSAGPTGSQVAIGGRGKAGELHPILL